MRLRSNRSSLDKADGLILASIASHLAEVTGGFYYPGCKEWNNTKEVCMLSLTCKNMHDACQSVMMHSSSALHAILTHGGSTHGEKKGLVRDAMLSILRSTNPFAFSEDSKSHFHYTDSYAQDIVHGGDKWGISTHEKIEIKALDIPVAGEVIFLLTDTFCSECAHWGGVSLLHCAIIRPFEKASISCVPEELCVHSLAGGESSGSLRRFDMEAVKDLKEFLKMVPGNPVEALSTPQLVSLLAYQLGAEFEQVMFMLHGTSSHGKTETDVTKTIGADGPYGDYVRIDGPGDPVWVREGGVQHRQIENGVRVRNAPSRYGGLSALKAATNSICEACIRAGYAGSRSKVYRPTWFDQRTPMEIVFGRDMNGTWMSLGLSGTVGCDDIDRELLRVVTHGMWEFRGPLLEQGAQYTAAISPSDCEDNPVISGMMPLHFACRNGAPTAIIKEIYQAYPTALFCTTCQGFTPLNLLDDVMTEGAARLRRRGYTMARARTVKAFLEAEMDHAADDQTFTVEELSDGEDAEWSEKVLEGNDLQLDGDPVQFSSEDEDEDDDEGIHGVDDDDDDDDDDFQHAQPPA